MADPRELFADYKDTYNSFHWRYRLVKCKRHNKLGPVRKLLYHNTAIEDLDPTKLRPAFEALTGKKDYRSFEAFKKRVLYAKKKRLAVQQPHLE